MFTSFSTALSALNAHSVAVDVVGNNLANLNTTGFKASTVSFHDLVTQSMGVGGGQTQVGFGIGRPYTTRQFSQGAIQATSGLMDAAIQGDGFFVIKDPQGATQFTRAGNFALDKAGNLLTATGQRVQGWAENNGVIDVDGPIGDIAVPMGALQAPSATENFAINANLNASTPVGKSFSSSMEVVDSLGSTHVLTVRFTNDGVVNGLATWSYQVSIPPSELAPTDPPETEPVPVTDVGTIAFDSNGTLVSPELPGGIPVTVTGLANGASDLNITWHLYNPSGSPRLTQYSGQSAISGNEQDGLQTAELIRVGIGPNGAIVALYSSGKERAVGQLALATIRNPESLVAVGDNAFQTTASSGMPAFGMPQSGGRGRIVGSSLEYSTVDIAREFTNLIVLQRGYQANAKIVTVVDEMSQETINLKR
jgi:flagellar hook protein FlgE